MTRSSALNFNWEAITLSAYKTLGELKLREFPIPADKIKCKGVKIASYQKYSKLTDCSIQEITCGNELKDAFLLKGLRPGLTLILYNDEANNRRMKHTLWHEIGHIKCGHKQHGPQEEIEAHFFASQANAPNALIKEIARRGYSITTSFLMSCFGLSQEAASKKTDYLKRYPFSHSNEYDEILLAQFSNFINVKYPLKAKKAHDDYYDELEQERKGWY